MRMKSWNLLSTRVLLLATLLFFSLSCKAGGAVTTAISAPPDYTAISPLISPTSPVQGTPAATQALQVTATVFLPTVVNPTPAVAIRAFPDAWNGIHIFNDQLASALSDAQIAFAASHYAGTQKMQRSEADRLRSYNPNFVILHYRLGIGLGYRSIQNGCNPTGGWLYIIEGDDWVQEWPGDANVVEDWFYHWPELSLQRVLNCDWGWYLMNPDDPGWRAYWSSEVLRQLQANDDDGIFADSFSVPNYLGADQYDPALPAVDAGVENQWAARLEDFIQYVQQGALGGYYFIPNAGFWVTGRDPLDYSGADGVMIEGLAEWGGGSYFDLADWQLQMNRVLSLVQQDKIILGQQYIDPQDVNERMFVLGSYLLVKGHYTYLNFEIDMQPEWFPEYALPIGSPTGDPTGGIPADIEDLWNADWGVYARTYSGGLVLVNPSNVSHTIVLGSTYYQATPNGGGIVPVDGDISAWTVNYGPMTQVSLGPNRAVILLNEAP
jgi:hypothetical protein